MKEQWTTLSSGYSDTTKPVNYVSAFCFVSFILHINNGRCSQGERRDFARSPHFLTCTSPALQRILEPAPISLFWKFILHHPSITLLFSLPIFFFFFFPHRLLFRPTHSSLHLIYTNMSEFSHLQTRKTGSFGHAQHYVMLFFRKLCLSMDDIISVAINQSVRF